MIRIDALWLCAQPQDMRAGAERLLGQVVHALGRAQAHHGYLFANARATRVKLLVHDGFGVWCAARRLHSGRFAWPTEADATTPLQLTQAQFDALVVGLPWQRLAQMCEITRL
ncbi:transposase [Variovorax paradoxus]|uniref:IS66 family insertion sequence element accessory protein TnpB n=1 Tax=Variovorax atrisoli TaxID=3394203 RepID=UPI00119C22D4|nr:IS66 family insertion sequence element accessory protein TnpB [Variovorax paradoxus]MDR6524618.1 transposase [Variovorax paradoxus]